MDNLLVCPPQTGHFAMLSYSVITGVGRVLLRMRNLVRSLTNAVHYHRLVYLEMFFLLNFVGICYYLAPRPPMVPVTLSRLLWDKWKLQKFGALPITLGRF